MRIITAKLRPDFVSFLIGAAFFLSTGLVLRLYDVSFAPIFLALILFIYARFWRKIDNLPTTLDLALLGALAVALSILTSIIFKLKLTQYEFFTGYGMPVIGFAILATMLFDNLEFSVLFSIFVSVLGASVGTSSVNNFNVLVSLLSASIVSSMLSFRVRRRFQVVRAGFVAGVICLFVASIMEGWQSLFIYDFSLTAVCLISGIIYSILVLGSLSFFEYAFKVVTNLSLLELSDFNHPLLRRLILEAPGTYQHSLVVANLSEAAAESIGANSLLARVGAYYHDIGKMLKPDYFVENQVTYRDIHKDLKPSMSKLIIVNHVKDGIELATKHHINSKIIDFIIQHHGRTLVYYFYHRAKELEPHTEPQEEYRYQGPKPQSKEIAIVALADTIEALSRTLEEPNPSRIEETAREVVRKRFMEGELDETTLTLQELEKITRSFIRILNAIFHTRINYPKNENRNIKPAKDKENKP
ncbi:MAG: HDIG domain-containing metalloprotein [Candidatus Omnitrophota bacterium]